MASDLERRLLRLKQQVEEAREEKARLEGQLQATLDQLREEFGVKDLAAAEALLTAQERKATKLREQLQQTIVNIEEQYNAG